MRYSFADFYKLRSLDSQILFIYGKHTLFNNMLIDSQRAKCSNVPPTETALASDVLEELSVFAPDIDTDTGSSVITSLEFKDFCGVCRMPCLVGKWFCCLDIKDLDTVSRQKLDVYISKPSEYGLLILYTDDYKTYKAFERDSRFRLKSKVNLINLSYPTIGALKQIVTEMFTAKGLFIDNAARDLFIARIGQSYSDYPYLIDRFIGLKDRIITYNDVHQLLSDVDNYVIDDMFTELTKPITKDKKTNRKIYKILKSLLNTYTAEELLTKLHYKAKDALEMRLYINLGYIPVGFAYSVPEVQQRIGGGRLSSISAYSFKRLANIASLTSLADWILITELTKVNKRNSYGALSDLNCHERLHLLIHRDLYAIPNESRKN